MATPDIHLLAIENWTTLADSVDFNTVTETLNSSTSYTASDSTSGLSLNIVGTGFHDRKYLRLHSACDAARSPDSRFR